MMHAHAESDERRWYRHDERFCTGCGYDLTGNESGKCPECGWDVAPAMANYCLSCRAECAEQCVACPVCGNAVIGLEDARPDTGDRTECTVVGKSSKAWDAARLAASACLGLILGLFPCLFTGVQIKMVDDYLFKILVLSSMVAFGCYLLANFRDFWHNVDPKRQDRLVGRIAVVTMLIGLCLCAALG